MLSGVGPIKYAHAMHPEVEEIKRKMLNQPWPRYLRSLQIAGLRGWGADDASPEIRFDFPVTVVAGENGAGKSTVLKAAAAAYAHPTDKASTFYPATFFPDTAWDRISGVTLTYKIREGTADKTFALRKRTERWRMPERPKRYVFWQDISRTLPIDATAGYARLAKRTATESSATALNAELTTYYSAILGRRYDSARLARSNIDASRLVGVVKIGPQQFSQFHQGAGEDATLDLLSTLQNIPDYSLVLIDEVEASLHPRSQRRLIHFLLWLARNKSIQVIVSTHSSYVLEELPYEARVFLTRGAGGVEVLYGPTPNYALSRMDDIDRPDLYLFTEDQEASSLVVELLRSAPIDLGRVRCMEVGPASMVRALGRLADRRRLPVRAIGVLDANEGPSDGCVRLPGSRAPEREVLEAVLAYAIQELAKRLGVAEASVRDALERAMAASDHHQWVPGAARVLNQSPSYLWTTMGQVYAKACVAADEREAFAAAIVRALP